MACRLLLICSLDSSLVLYLVTVISIFRSYFMIDIGWLFCSVFNYSILILFFLLFTLLRLLLRLNKHTVVVNILLFNNISFIDNCLVLLLVIQYLFI